MWTWRCVLLALAFPALALGAEAPHKRFEYKFSFKPPYLAQKDGTVPFFEYFGSKLKIASADS